jgi:hypothetical protein
LHPRKLPAAHGRQYDHLSSSEIMEMTVPKFRLFSILLFSTLLSAQQIQVRINNRLDSESTPPGSGFQGVLMDSVRIAGRNCAKGSPVGGVVTETKSSGRLHNPGVLVLEPAWVTCSGRRLSISAEPIRLEGRSHTKRNAVLIAGGAGAGAILGGIVGGGKGSLIGGLIGAGSGTAAAAATGKKPAVVEAEAVVAWELSGASSRGQDRPQQQVRQHSQPQPDYRTDGGSTNNHHSDADGDRNYDDNDDRDDGRYRDYRINDHDRAYLRRCLGSNYRLPPGLAKQGKIPPGHARKMAQAGYEPIPGACTAKLSPIPRGWERVIVENRVVLLDPARRQIDFFVWVD